MLGAEHVCVGAPACQAYLADASGIERSVPAVLKIPAADVLPGVLRIAREHSVAVYPISTGRNWGYGTSLPAGDGCVILDLSLLNRILDFDPELGVVTLEPGVTQGMLAAFLEAGHHEFLVPTTGAGPHCSVLANALERGYGITPVADHFAAVTDLEAVLADGTTYRTALREAGGEELARIFKWGIGPYSAGLFTQSGFGIVTRATITLARRPACVRAFLFSIGGDDSLGPAVNAVRAALSSLPGIVGGINLMNRRRVLSMTAPYPHGAVGNDGTLPAGTVESLGKQYAVHPWTGFATLYGTRRVVVAAQRELQSIIGPIAARKMAVSPELATRLAGLARWIPGSTGKRLGRTAATLASSLELVCGRPNETALALAYWRRRGGEPARPLDPSRDGCGLLWYAPLVPMREDVVRAFVAMVERVAPRHGIEPLITLTSLNDRVFDSTVPLLFARDDATAVRRARQCHTELLEAGSRLGCFPYRLDIDSMPMLASRLAAASAFHARLRSAVDSDGILAPGRYG